ncbi:MAG: GNAT family N-acetyltransferase [Terriglobales bacterium]
MSTSAAAAGLPGQPQASLQVGKILGLPELEGLAPEWAAMVAPGRLTPLTGPAWVLAHARAYERADRVAAIYARRGGQLIAVLPLVRERGWLRGLPVRLLRSAAGHVCLRFDLSADGEAWNADVATAMFRCLADWEGWDCFMLREVPRGGFAEAVQAAAAAAGYQTGRRASMQSRYLDPMTFTPTGELRHKLRRTRRRLEESGAVEFETSTEANLERLHELFTLEASGWKGRRGGNAVLRKGERQVRFFLDMAAGAAAQGQLRLHRLLCGGGLVATALGLRDVGGYYAVKWCYDERYAKYSPGNLLIEAIIQQCQADRLTRFDFTGDDYPYKREWTSLTLEHAFLYVFRPGLLGGALHRWKFGPDREPAA